MQTRSLARGGAAFAPPRPPDREVREIARAIEKCRAKLEGLAAVGDVLADRAARMEAKTGPIARAAALDLERAFERWGDECRRRVDEMRRLRDERRSPPSA